MYAGIYVGQARWSLGGTGRYERGSAIAANRPLFVPAQDRSFLLSPSLAALRLVVCAINRRLSSLRYHYHRYHRPADSTDSTRMRVYRLFLSKITLPRQQVEARGSWLLQVLNYDQRTVVRKI